MPKSQKVSMADLERLAFDNGAQIEHDPETGLSFAMKGGRELAWAVSDTSRPGVSA